MADKRIREGDICTLDESVEFLHIARPPFQVLVLWNGINGQPLVTKLTEYSPFWTTYSQLTKVERHIELDSWLEKIPFV